MGPNTSTQTDRWALHITCAYTGQANVPNSGITRQDTQPFISSPVWSETILYDGVTSHVAPSDGCIFIIQSVAKTARFISIGPDPDPTKSVSTNRNDTRIPYHRPSGDDVPPLILYAKAGDKVGTIVMGD